MEDNDPVWNSLNCTCGASGVAVMAHEPHCAVILIESLSAQVAGYILAMAVLQSDLDLDDTEEAARDYFLPKSLKG